MFVKYVFYFTSEVDNIYISCVAKFPISVKVKRSESYFTLAFVLIF